MSPRRPPPYTSGKPFFASAVPTEAAAVEYSSLSPGDDAQLGRQLCTPGSAHKTQTGVEPSGSDMVIV